MVAGEVEEDDELVVEASLGGFSLFIVVLEMRSSSVSLMTLSMSF